MFKNSSKTEQLFSKSKPIDKLLEQDAFKLMVNEHKKGIDEVDKVLPELQKVVNEVFKILSTYNNSRIIYSGAGTSGRLGVQDGVELCPTFGWPMERLGFLIAGGKEALMKSVENSEDNFQKAAEDVKSFKINNSDVVIGISASGNTPYTCEVLKKSKLKQALTICITNNKNAEIIKYSDFCLLLNTNQEVIAGSTRLKAGTAQKVCLNTLSSMVMIKLGKVKNGMMINMIANNKKLRKRKLEISNVFKNCI